MGKTSFEANYGEELTLKVDDRGRVTLPKKIRDQLGIESNDEVPATLVGSVLEVNPKPSAKLETATAGRDDWENTTPTDAGKALFGPKDR
ncbi:AbrB/MazE/SpoVT family DNA-binding domain-containing protein [Halobacteria archaeon AArc-m2/3/4]|uniref:AbrB/MazE/SpoVT family DNA-binding domain-containing protein n=1 Tax=Natronoglomus mannanivorans TaxID=2979990 RepID=A0AAP3E3N5_9EURY|nr:AbrB/MazE/SpoVT family DNA-binding domain-containing protein [Halobacteria archaeon AArc-xg1-1]MCU4974923.1 AbrB/MazE/SpoVT family DNA-binding domain-containing protein [Halobacteria archaeon AArc-m2/3/4]